MTVVCEGSTSESAAVCQGVGDFGRLVSGLSVCCTPCAFCVDSWRIFHESSERICRRFATNKKFHPQGGAQQLAVAAQIHRGREARRPVLGAGSAGPTAPNGARRDQLRRGGGPWLFGFWPGRVRRSFAHVASGRSGHGFCQGGRGVSGDGVRLAEAVVPRVAPPGGDQGAGAHRTKDLDLAQARTKVSDSRNQVRLVKV